MKISRVNLLFAIKFGDRNFKKKKKHNL